MGLPNNFYSCPSTATTTMETKKLKALLLENDGLVIACGHIWEIESKRIGPGVYRVWLKRKNPNMP